MANWPATWTTEPAGLAGEVFTFRPDQDRWDAGTGPLTGTGPAHAPLTAVFDGPFPQAPVPRPMRRRATGQVSGRPWPGAAAAGASRAGVDGELVNVTTRRARPSVLGEKIAPVPDECAPRATTSTISVALAFHLPRDALHPAGMVGTGPLLGGEGFDQLASRALFLVRAAVGPGQGGGGARAGLLVPRAHMGGPPVPSICRGSVGRSFRGSSTGRAGGC